MGGDTKIQGGQGVAPVQSTPQANGQKKPETAAEQSMPLIPAAGDQVQTQIKAGGKIPKAPIQLDSVSDDPDKAAQARLLNFSQQVIQAHEDEIRQGHPLHLTDDELLRFMEMTEDIIDSDDLLGGYYYRNAFQGMYKALAASLAELRNPPPAPDKAASWSPRDEESVKQTKLFAEEFLEVLQEVVNTEKARPDAGEPANKRHIRVLEKLQSDVKGDLPSLTASAKDLILEERHQRAFDVRQRRHIDEEKMTKVQEGLTLGAAGAVAVGLAVWKRHEVVAGLKKTPQVIKESAEFLKDLGVSAGKKIGKVSVRTGRNVLKPIVVRVRSAFGVKPAPLPAAEQALLNSVRSNFETAVGQENFAAIEKKLNSKIYRYAGKFDDILRDAIKDTQDEVKAAIKAGTAEAANITEKEIAEFAAHKAYMKLTKIPGLLGSIRYQLGKVPVINKVPLLTITEPKPNWRIDPEGKPIMSWDPAVATLQKGAQELSWSSVAAASKKVLGKAKSVGVGGVIFGTLQEAPEVASGRVSGNHFLGNVSRMVTDFGGFELGAAGTAAAVPLLLGTPPGWVVTGVVLVGGLIGFAVTDHYAGKKVSTGVTNGLDYVADKTGVNVGTGAKYIVYAPGKGIDWVEHNTGGFGRFMRNWLLKPFDEGDREGALRGAPKK